MQTPADIKYLRREDLLSIRGTGKGERKLHERIDDYALYNDLGNPDKDLDIARPIAGAEDRPYPRRYRTGRPPTTTDPLTESRIEKSHPIYVPRDEAFEEIKQDSFSAGRLKALFHNLIPLLAATLSSSDIPFNCFSEIDKLYTDGVVLRGEEHKDMLENLVFGKMMKQVLNVGERFLKYDIPVVIKSDRFSWLHDNEFARQTLAGVNPVNIELLKAIEEKRLFILDFHDMLLPFIRKINSLRRRKAYASRTVLFHTPKGILRPLAIEVSLPPTPSSPWNKQVYTHGHDATTYWTWKFAKAHVCSNDAGIHQLVNHW
ncbi:hypothetical protein K1719_003123 [Acacia pycnantha]|nr:hypothetical protein K1719_003123 [Acacia pycnantha]